MAKMCSGLDDFVNNTNENITLCRRDDKCTMVTCTVQDPTISQVILNSQTTFLPCTSPPAISISFLRPNGSLFSFHLVNRTTEVFLLATPILVEDFMVTLHISLLINVSHTPNCLQIEVRKLAQFEKLTFCSVVWVVQYVKVIAMKFNFSTADANIYVEDGPANNLPLCTCH